ncbi:hypothetical protein BDN70DRAFT_45309 [Pholiota conissans]|uniref:PPM-type phosphatase domain-containing protein n=1 Tax=Pholiota conissans TaxID=109636 RepID=A0A9P5Z2A7_9AGAR|nr:hypothetical protein BDN70DRAFT_45309 [Pholiota conissans]
MVPRNPDPLHEEVIGDPPSDDCLTPPYATAEPVVTTMKDIKNGDFAIFASDGLWESLTSEEVVGLVGQWLGVNGMSERVPDIDGNYRIVRVPRPAEFVTGEAKQDTSLIIPKGEYLPRHKAYRPSDLPVIYPPRYKDTTQRYKQWKHEKKFLCEDDFVGLHLMQNTLGGANVDLSWALTYLKMPMARRFRDGIAIIVVFFD